MMTATHSLTDDYLRRLERSARDLPRDERDELVSEIRSHFDSGLRPDATEAEVRNLLDELGPPEDIVAAAQPPRPPVKRGAREVFALILLVFGLPPILGWLVGLGLLLWSPLWTARQKVLAILVWPGGYAGSVLWLGLIAVGRAGTCPVQPGGAALAQTDCVSSGPSPLLVLAGLLVVVAPLVVATYLYRAAGRAVPRD